VTKKQKFETAEGVKPWDKVLDPLMALSISFPLVIGRDWIIAIIDHLGSRYGSTSWA
jgi:hypothetical protein